MIKDTSKQMAKVAVEALKEKKGYDVKVIDISEISILADYFIIANGSNAIRCRLWLTMLKSRCTRLALMTLR